MTVQDYAPTTNANEFRVFPVIGATLKALVSNAPIVLLSVVAGCCFWEATNYFIAPYTGASVEHSTRIIVLLGANIVLFGVAYVLLQGILIDRVDGVLLRKPRPLLISIKKALTCLPALALCSFPITLYSLASIFMKILPDMAILLGLSMIFTLFAAIVFFPAAPACLAENLTGSQALSRSATLTRGYRLRIFGATLIFSAIYFAITFTCSFIPSFLESFLLKAFQLAFSWMPYAKLGFSLFGIFVANSLHAILREMTYHSLVTQRDGVRFTRVADIFE